MRLPKLEKVESDIACAKAKIAEYQEKLRALEKLKTEVENDRKLKMLRDEKISDAELSALLESYRKSQVNGESVNTVSQTGRQAVKEETYDAEA